MVSVKEHYDLLIEHGNDTMQDTPELQRYMDKWDGEIFIEQLELSQDKTFLEIGCGTGRILNKILGQFKSYVGVDISPKTVAKAREYFPQSKVEFICGDFLEVNIGRSFDVVFSTLTFMHIKDKLTAVEKVYSLLGSGGQFLLSIDKNQTPFIDTGYSKIEIYPDDTQSVCNNFRIAGFVDIKIFSTEFAYIITARKE